MRDIKFRAILKNEFIIRDVLAIDFLNLKVLVNISGSHEWHPYRKGCLEQYTGLDDKNGVPIFEGDIVETAFGEKGVIVYSRCWFYIDDEKAAPSDRLLGNFADMRDLEVIGNIHEEA